MHIEALTIRIRLYFGPSTCFSRIQLLGETLQGAREMAKWEPYLRRADRARSG